MVTSLSSDGEFNVFNNNGVVRMLIDVNGYYTNTSLQELANRLTAAEAAIAVNTGDIDGLDAREPFAVTDGAGGNILLTATPTVFASVDVTAPVDGQVTLNSTAFVRHLTKGGLIACAIYEAADIPPVDIVGQTPSVQLWTSVVIDPPGSFTGAQGSLSGTRTFDIAADTTVTYSLACDEILLDGGSILERNLTAIFTPAP